MSTEYTQSQAPYQAGVVPTSLAESLPDGTTSSTPMRVIPDVSALADPSTGILVGQTTLQPDGKTYAFSLSRIGGTSVAYPRVRRHRGGRAAGGRWRTWVRQPGDLLPGHALQVRVSPDAAFNDVTDHPLGPGYLARCVTTTPTRTPSRARC